MNKDDLNQILDRNIAWIENCDNKSSIALGYLGIAVGLIFALDYATIFLNVIQEKFSNMNLCNFIFLCSILISVVVFAYGGYKLILSLTPKIDAKVYNEDDICNDSLIFFSSISRNRNYKSYCEKLDKIDDDDYLNDIKSQIYICSKICDTKFKSYKLGLILSLIGLLSFLILISYGYCF